MDGVTCVQVWRCVCWRLSTSKELTRFSWSDQIRHLFNPPAPNMSSDFFFGCHCHVRSLGVAGCPGSGAARVAFRSAVGWRLWTSEARAFSQADGGVTPVKTCGAFKIVKGNCQLLN